MEKRVHLYVSRKHLCVWLMALCMIASSALRIVWDRGDLWFGAVLPTAAAAIFVLTVVLCGSEMLYRTAAPIWMLGLCYAIHSGAIAAWIASLVFCFCYTQLISGKNKKIWLLILFLLALTGCIYAKSWADAVMILGMLLLWPAIKVHTDGKYHPTWKDRADGRYIRSAPAIQQITPFIMPQRVGANLLFDESVEITELDRYVRAKRREADMPNFGMTHAIIAAYVRTVAKYPALNRFVAGQRIYARDEDIAVCMTVKKEMTRQSPDTVIKVHFHPGDTARDVYEKFNAAVISAKDEMENSDVDNAAGILTSTPRMVLKFVVWLVRVLDYFGMAPKFLLELSPFHGSIYFTSMGSLGIKPVYHHLYDFGTVPAFCAFGKKRRAEEIRDGEMVERKYMDLRFNLDERICDGFYYASVIKYFMRLLAHPEVLDEAPKTIEQDIS